MRSPLHGLATRLGMGEVARKYYHHPLADLGAMVREGGPVERKRTELGRLEMIQAARRLAPTSPPASTLEYEVNFLSGERYWHQTLFCICSLQMHSPVRIVPVVYDDGSFNRETMGAISRVVPWTRFVGWREIEASLDKRLPADRFPNLRARRVDYPHLRKLTDIHVDRIGWNAVLDSDMLFFRPPTLFLSWLETPDRPCHLIDPLRAYGYSESLLVELTGHPEPKHVNVGICGLRSETIDWDRLEYWCRVMLEREGPSYFQEQALTAMLLAGQTCLRLPEEDYRVMPSVAEGKHPSAALHHYVAHSKRSYFQHGWRNVVIAGSRLPLGSTFGPRLPTGSRESGNPCAGVTGAVGLQDR